MKIKIFSGYVDFYNFIKDNDLGTLSSFFSDFMSAYENINVGCGCNRNKRISNTIVAYKDIATFFTSDTDLVSEIKERTGATEIQMYLEEQLLYQG